VARLPELQSKLLAAILAKAWRGEASLCRQFDRNWLGNRASEARSVAVEDALFALVRAGKIEWFGGGDQGFGPLKYRAACQGGPRG
jgi:hypothetical protein